MDKFEQMMKDVKGKTPSELAKEMEKYKSVCICPTCPATPEFGLKNKSFCMKGAEKGQRYEHALWGTKIP